MRFRFIQFLMSYCQKLDFYYKSNRGKIRQFPQLIPFLTSRTYQLYGVYVIVQCICIMQRWALSIKLSINR
jgi:hypothetical protein